MQEQVGFHGNIDSRMGRTVKHHTFDMLILKEPRRFHSNIVGERDWWNCHHKIDGEDLAQDTFGTWGKFVVRCSIDESEDCSCVRHTPTGCMVRILGALVHCNIVGVEGRRKRVHKALQLDRECVWAPPEQSNTSETLDQS